MLSMLCYCGCYLSIYAINIMLLWILSINLRYQCYAIVGAIYQSTLSILCSCGCYLSIYAINAMLLWMLSINLRYQCCYCGCYLSIYAINAAIVDPIYQFTLSM